jgi:hypothetical protein
MGTGGQLSGSSSIEASSYQMGTAHVDLGDKSAGCHDDPLSSGSPQASSIRKGRVDVELGEDIQLTEALAEASEEKGPAAGDLKLVA